jgi:enhanced filamentous growth protein 1
VVPEEDEQEQDNEGEYPQAAASYAAPQNSYSYNPAPVPNAAEIPRVAEIASPQQNGTGGVTPRTSGTPAAWNGGYPTPQRSNTAPGAAGNLYNVVDNRDTPNGSTDGYYQAAVVNGNMGSAKRSREDDDDDAEDSKRQRTEQDEGGPVGGPNGSPYAVPNNRRIAQPKR